MTMLSMLETSRQERPETLDYQAIVDVTLKQNYMVIGRDIQTSTLIGEHCSEFIDTKRCFPDAQGWTSVEMGKRAPPYWEFLGSPCQTSLTAHYHHTTKASNI